MGPIRSLAHLVALQRVLRLASTASLTFGTEAPLAASPNPDLWHHEGLTQRGSEGWSRRAARHQRAGALAAREALAWHADFLDSYAYNAEWWLNPVRGGGPRRLEVALSTHAELVKLHCDDLFSLDQVEATMRRCLSGTVCALMWLNQAGLARDLRVACGHQVIGASLHTVQDFYSHSNWVDEPSRRTATWFDFAAQYGHRDVAFIYTGSYEKEPQLGLHPHGTVEFACAVLRNLGIGEDLLDILCSGASPLTKSGLCDNHRRCRLAAAVNLQILDGLPLPDGLAWIDPHGMNLDSYWQAPVGRRTRGITDLSSAETFQVAYRLAARASCQWLAMLETACAEAGVAALYAELASASVPRRLWTVPWERFDLLPYQFLTAGPYPPPAGDERNWYLRLLIETGAATTANTNATIEAEIEPVAGQRARLPLDHGPQRGAGAFKELASFNDWKRGSTAAYMIGPFAQMPQELVLHNTAPSLGDVVVLTLEKVAAAIMSVLGAIVGIVKALIGWSPECVGTATALIPPSVLLALDPAGPRLRGTMRVDGGDEGCFDIDYSIEALRAKGQQLPSGHAGFSYRVWFETITCIRESVLDGLFSERDEIFVVGYIGEHGSGRPGKSWRSRVFEGGEAFNAGSRRPLRKDFAVTVPLFGALTLPVAVWESDHETGGERDEIQRAFATGTAQGAADLEPGLITQIGASLGQGWQLAAISGVAYRRGEVAELVPLARTTVNAWIDGGESRTVTLTAQGAASAAHVPDSVDPKTVNCIEVVLPPVPDLEPAENPDHDPQGFPYSPKKFRPDH